MLNGLLLSIAQLRDPAILRVLARSLAVTIAIFVALMLAVYAALTSIDGCVRPLGVAICGGAELSGVGTLLLSLVALWLLFPIVAIGVVGLFSDTVVGAVERKHYPSAAAGARPPNWGRSAKMGLASAARIVGYNLVAAPFYLLLLITGVGPFLLGLAVNAFALGRDLWEMVAARHQPSSAMRAELAATGGLRIALGLATAALFVVPVLNLLAPVIGAAWATHLYHRGRT